MRSRYEVKLEKYNKLLNIECNVMDRMVRRDYWPAINAFATKVAHGITEVNDVSPMLDTTAQEELLSDLQEGLKRIAREQKKLNERHAEAQALSDQQERANAYAGEVIPVMRDLRAAVDGMELIVGAEYWPVPSYNRMLFYA